MSTQTDSDNHPIRAEPQRLLKPTTLPHVNSPDAGAGGERSEPYNCEIKQQIQVTPTPSTEAIRTFTQSSSQTQVYLEENTVQYTAILFIAIRIAFYLFVVTFAVMLTLAACKFTNFWDPCEHLYINTTECKVTSYLKGMIYHTDCTEEYYCILPGFHSNIKRKEWSLHKPNETAVIQNHTLTADPDQFLI